MKDLKFECIIKKTEKKESETKDTAKKEGVITLETEAGEVIKITGDQEILQGVKVKEEMVVVVKNPQTTLK